MPKIYQNPYSKLPFRFLSGNPTGLQILTATICVCRTSWKGKKKKQRDPEGVHRAPNLAPRAFCSGNTDGDPQTQSILSDGTVAAPLTDITLHSVLAEMFCNVALVFACNFWSLDWQSRRRLFTFPTQRLQNPFVLFASTLILPLFWVSIWVLHFRG